MRCVLALDSGGTKCEAALARDDGVVLGWGLCHVPGLSGRSERASLEAAKAAMKDVKSEIDELHIACVGQTLPIAFFQSKRPVGVQVHAVAEHEGALSLVGQQFGIVVLAGTGAFVHVKTRDGRVLHLDGLGPLLGDYGSGYHIGYLALRAAMRASWHPRHKTSLEQTVFNAFKARSAAEMVPLNWAVLDRCVVAALALEVDKAANAGDTVAVRILETAAAAMAETLRDAVDSLGIAGESYVMVGTGSVAKRSKLYWNHLCQLTRSFAPNLRPELSPLPAAAGIALVALQRLGAVAPQTLRENLFASATEFLQQREQQLEDKR